MKTYVCLIRFNENIHKIIFTSQCENERGIFWLIMLLLMALLDMIELPLYCRL